MFPLVDFHCHLDLYPDFDKQVSKCEAQNIFTLTVTTTPAAWKRNFEVTSSTKHVRAALGYHPQLIESRPHEIKLWESYLSETKYIGEVGLDAGPKFYRSFQQQIEVFEHIAFACAEAGGKILSIHSVRSANKVLEIIERSKLHLKNKIVLHWFSGSISEAKKAIDLGCYFSINEQMISGPKAQSLLDVIPFEKILTETDGPFSLIGNKSANPGDVINCIQKIANYKNFKQEVVQQQIFENLKSIIKD